MLNVLPASVVASIPSPGFNVFHLGFLTLRMYGLCIAVGVVVAVSIASKRWERRGGNPDDIGSIAIWAVPAGVVGARLYHVATDWKKYQHDWIQAFNITNGGLGIPGGVLLGVLAGLIVTKRKKLPALPLLDVVAPALPVAQAIGRLGNWFNQELYGRPSHLPWALRIDAEHRVDLPAKYASATTFHPTFLYEALWNLALAGLLIWLDRKKKLRPGELFTLYVLGYAIGRLWVEELRIDPASLLLGIRVNIWMSVIVGAVAIVVFARNRRRGHAAELATDLGAGLDAEPEAGLATADDADRGDPTDLTDVTADPDVEPHDDAAASDVDADLEAEADVGDGPSAGV